MLSLMARRTDGANGDVNSRMHATQNEYYGQGQADASADTDMEAGPR